MSRHLRTLLVAAVAVLLCSGLAVAALRGGDDVTAPATTTSSSTSTSVTTTTTEPPTTTTEPLPVLPPVPGDGTVRAVVTPTGVVAPVLADAGGGRFVVASPCGNEVAAPGQAITGAHVVLDPGHGGDEPGAVGPAGTEEKAVNLAVAQRAKERLEELGATVVLTRTGDYRVTLATRGTIVTRIDPLLFISVHHNAEPDEQRATPGSETYFQIASAESKRAAGLLYEELLDAFAPYGISWAADFDAGAKYRPNGRGGDYYAVLSRTAGVPAVLSEAAFISNPEEEALLRDPAFQAVEGEAIAEAAIRFLTTDDPGSGYVEPYPRTQPAGRGGGGQGCVDPPLE